jgi:hypothetical protein
MLSELQLEKLFATYCEVLATMLNTAKPLVAWPTFPRSRSEEPGRPPAKGYASPAAVIDVTPSQEKDE